MPAAEMSAKTPELPNSEEFTRALGQATWLLTISKEHRDKTAAWIEAHVVAPLMFKQLRVFLKGKQPVAAIVWAYVSPEVKTQLDAGGYTMRLQDWRSGPEVAVVDCIAPFGRKQSFTDAFLQEVEAARAAVSH